MPNQEWTFYFLKDLNAPVVLPTVEVAPLEDKERAFRDLEPHIHLEGWLYPPKHRQYPSERSAIVGHLVETEPVANSERPAFLYDLQPSHSFVYKGPEADDPDRVLPGAILQFIAYVFGTRLQFGDWGMDQRLQVTRCQTPFHFNETRDLHALLDRAISTLLSLTSARRLVLLNLLTMHNRAAVYEWPWERFMWRYTSFDAMWKFFSDDVHFEGKVSHRQRINLLCDHFKIPVNQTWTQKLGHLRNNLVHEACWDERRAGRAGSSEASYAEMPLRQLMDRLIMFAFDVPCSFRQTRWGSRSHVGLGLAKDND